MATGTQSGGILARPTSIDGVWGWITTVDAKRIGMMYITTSILFFLWGGIQALLVRTQLSHPGAEFVSPDTYNSMFTMHALTMIFLAIMPMSVGFFNLVVPLQIGARDVAFPRMNALSYWVYLFGGILLSMGWLVGEAASAGWFAYAPLTESAYAANRGMDFYVLGLLVLGTSSMAGAFNFIVTIINLRAPGMSFFKLPVFVWMTFLTSILLVTAFPVITVALIELMFDRYLGANFFIASQGGDPLLWQHLFWVFGHPEVYILILPAMGIVSEVLPTFARKPLFGYSVIIFSGIVIGVMGWMVWSHHMFTVGLGTVAVGVFTVTTMLIAVPTGVKVFSWMATLWKGSIALTTANLYSIGFIALFVIGGLSGVSHAMSSSDFQQHETYYVIAHIHYVLFGGSIMALFSGLYYWYPKFTGRMMDERYGKVQFWMLFAGMNICFGPMHWVGMDGMPRRIYTYASNMGWDFWNMISTIGAFILGFSILLLLHNLVRSLKKGEIADGDPWDGRTLEWSIPSPAPHYNFARIPTVTDRDDWWARKYATGDDGITRPVPQGGAYGHGEEDVDVHSIHLPDPSYWPLVTAIGMALMGGGFAFHLAITVVGALIMTVGIYGWAFEPVNEPSDDH